MAFEIGTASSSGFGGDARYDFLEKVRLFVTGNASLVAANRTWEVMRYNTGVADRELILRAPGIAGNEPVYIGLRAYRAGGTGFYNLSIMMATGYIEAAAFTAQPNMSPLCGIPALNTSFAYWLVASGQSLTMVLKVGSPGRYMHATAQAMLRQHWPHQHPYPYCVGGMLNGELNVAWDDGTSLPTMPYIANNRAMHVLEPAGTWLSGQSLDLWAWPWDDGSNPRAQEMWPTNDVYALSPVILHKKTTFGVPAAPFGIGSVYGELLHVRHLCNQAAPISGVALSAEDTTTLASTTYVVFPDWNRTAADRWMTLELAA